MKRNILKMFAVITAFFIGISINNSCGESKIDDGRSVQDLWNAIYALQAEVNALKTSDSTNGETLIDGLYFTRNGTVSYDSNTQRKYKYTQDLGSHSYYLTNTSTYTYDSKGRIQRITATSTNSTTGDSRSITTFEYSDKKVIKTVTTTDNNGNNSTSQTTEEYY